MIREYVFGVIAIFAVTVMAYILIPVWIQIVNPISTIGNAITDPVFGGSNYLSFANNQNNIVQWSFILLILGMIFYFLIWPHVKEVVTPSEGVY